MTDVTFASPEVRISLHQHVGAPAVAVVAAGDVVIKGQLIADVPEGLANVPFMPA